MRNIYVRNLVDLRNDTLEFLNTETQQGFNAKASKNHIFAIDLYEKIYREYYSDVAEIKIAFDEDLNTFFEPNQDYKRDIGVIKIAFIKWNSIEIMIPESVRYDVLFDDEFWNDTEIYFTKIKSNRPIPTGVILQLSSFDLTTRIGHPIIEFNAHDLVTQYFANNDPKSLHITYPFDQLKGYAEERLRGT